jgi:excisionase family DNA binding protein
MRLDTSVSPSAPQPLLTLPEMADLLRVSRQTIYRWSRVGQLRPALRRVGRVLLFDRATVMQILEGGAR